MKITKLMRNTKIKHCSLCCSDQLKLVYKGPMRYSGGKKQLDTGHEIYYCSKCHVEQIHPFPAQLDCCYQDGTYWQENKMIDTNCDLLHSKALDENLLWLNKIGLNSLRNKKVIDFGCGTGAFLDLIKGFTLQSIGIEADPNLCSYVSSKGHTVFNSIQEAVDAGIKADILCSFDVLEHLPNPIGTLKNLHHLLINYSSLFIGVPNQDDFIKKLVPAYCGHFYHIEHMWYFSNKSLTHVVENAGFRFDKSLYLHKYNFMNLVEWAKTGTPPNLPTSNVIDEDLNSRFTDWLEDRGLASHLLIAATNVIPS